MAATLLELLEQLEDEWQDGSPPALNKYLDLARQARLTATPDDQREVLGELVRIDLEYRWRHPSKATDTFPSRPLLDDYRRTFPDLGADWPLDLILDEYRVRTRWGDRPAHDGYLLRFPSLADALAASLPRLDAELAAEPLRPESSDETGTQPQEHTPKKPSGGSPLLPTIPGYESAQEIAKGGMGAVYRLFDPDLSRDVAVKVLRPEYRSAPESQRRFMEEARITAQLQHPGIPPVHEIGQMPDGSPYLVMKLIKGRTLAALLDERPDLVHERGRFLGIFGQICQTVAYAHTRGVIHRDLKPSNIMVGAFGEVQVMDWGLAKVLSEETGPAPATVAPEQTVICDPRSASGSSETQAGSILGTLAYMPPEQAAGAVGQINQRSDVFSLGAILCAILTGKPPYSGENYEAVRLQAVRGKLDDAFARLDQCGAEKDLTDLARRCLAPEMPDRPDDAAAVAGAVQAFHARIEERSRVAERERAAAEARAHEQKKRRQMQSAMALVIAVALAAGTTGIYLKYRDAKEQETIAIRHEGIANQRAAELEAALIDRDRALKDRESALARAESSAADARKRLRNSVALSWLVFLWGESTSGQIQRLEQMDRILETLRRNDHGELVKMSEQLEQDISARGIRIGSDERWVSLFGKAHGANHAQFDFDSLYVNLFARKPARVIEEMKDYVPHYFLYWEPSRLTALDHLLEVMLEPDSPGVFQQYGKGLMPAERAELRFWQLVLRFATSPSDALFEQLIADDQFDSLLYHRLRESGQEMLRWAGEHRDLGDKSFFQPGHFTTPPQRLALFARYFHGYLTTHKHLIRGDYWIEADRFVRKCMNDLPGKEIAEALSGSKFDKETVTRIAESYPSHWKAKSSEAWKSARWDEAADHYRKILAVYPIDQETMRNVALALLNAGKFDDSRREFEKCLDVWPHDGWIRASYAEWFVKQNDDRQALAWLNAAEVVGDKSDYVRSLRRGCLSNLDLPSAAIEECSKQLTGSREEMKPRLLRARGFYYLKSGDYGKAIDDYQTALKLDPKSADNHLWLAEFYALCPDDARRDAGKAMEHLRKAEELGANKDWVLFTVRAIVDAENGRFSEAVSGQRNALETVKGVSDKHLSKMKEVLRTFEQGKPWREQPVNDSMPPDQVRLLSSAIPDQVKERETKILSLGGRIPERLGRNYKPKPEVAQVPAPKPDDKEANELAKQLYDLIMGDIEPDLLLAQIPKLDDKYKNESVEAKATRMKRYEAAYKKFDQEFAAFMSEVDETVARQKLDELRQYVTKHGLPALDKDQSKEGKELRKWVLSIRSSFRLGKLKKTPWLVKELEAIPGWRWSPD